MSLILHCVTNKDGEEHPTSRAGSATLEISGGLVCYKIMGGGRLTQNRHTPDTAQTPSVHHLSVYS